MSTEQGLAAAYAGLAPDRCPLCGSDPVEGTGHVRVGTDVQQVAPVADALRAHPERYLARLFTPHEVAAVGWPGAGVEAAAPGLAARYAAKESVIKVLRPRDAGVAWREIEIHREQGGWTSLQFSGSVRGLVNSLGLGDWALSFSHDGGYAVATVVAVRCTTVETT